MNLKMDYNKLFAALSVTILAIVYSLWYRYTGTEVQRKNTITSVQKSYDYVIIGGGTAGSVLGSRISEDDSISVLILEAGDHYDNIPGIHDPANAMTFEHTRADWDYMSSSNQGFLGLTDQKHFIAGGRVLGGSSAINYNSYVRGSPYHFDEWVTDYACDGWGYEDLLPYFKNVESMQIDRFQHSEYHNMNGPIAISEMPVSPLYEIFKSAANQIGYDEVDLNGPTQTGVGIMQYTIRDGIRSSAGKEYLSDETVNQRVNLDIAVNSIVTKIHILDKIARGAYFINDGRKQYVEARREVIVSAGALNSPQILMLSGIGPSHDLKLLDIPVVADLPVGKHLENHVGVVVHASFDKPYDSSTENIGSVLAKIKEALFGTCPTTYAPHVMQGFLHSDKSKIGSEKPNLQLILTQNIIDVSAAFNYDDTIAQEMRQSLHNKTGFSVFLFLTQPKSIGNITLKTKDVFDSPVCNLNQLTNEDDIKTLVKGIKMLENFTSADALKELGTKLKLNKHSFCSKHLFQSDDFWECFIRHTGIIAHHYSSTCRMGPVGDRSAVVDLSLKVIGVDNLRVCDASVFPSVTTGNTCAPVLAVAEKLADLIKHQM